MGGDFFGQRGRDQRQWTWLRREPKPGRPGPGRLLPRGRALVGAGFVALFTVATVGLFLAFWSDVGLPVATPAASPTATQGPGTPATAGPGLTATAAPAGPLLRLFLWGDRRGQWQAADLRAEASRYAEGEAIPFMLRIDGAASGSIFSVTLRYDCAVGGVAALDYLTGFERDVGQEPVLAEPGPGRQPPDAAAAIPDDASISFDDRAFEGERLLRLWGGTFESRPVTVVPSAPCTGGKLITLSLRAGAETLFLLWGAHLASSEDWPAGRGAAVISSDFGTEVAVPGLVPDSQALRIAPGAASP